ncbi:enteropeptidase-like [Theristicus caerulescens]
MLAQVVVKQNLRNACLIFMCSTEAELKKEIGEEQHCPPVARLIFHRAEADVNTHGYIGTFKILSGTSFTPALQNRSSADFKVLAFDVEQLIQNVFQASDLKNEFERCEISQFKKSEDSHERFKKSEISVVVIFNLYFTQMVTVEKVKDELVSGINTNKTNLTQTLKIDVKSIQVTAAENLTTMMPLTSSAPMSLTTSSLTPASV